MEIRVRPAEKNDVPHLLALIRELAVFENAEASVENTEAGLLEDGFGPNPAFVSFVAETGSQVVGFTISYIRYSTWRQKVLYLEDIYVVESHRGLGVGIRLMENQLSYAKKEGFPYLCFQVLEWNKTALRFYERFGATYDAEWVNALIPVPLR